MFKSEFIEEFQPLMTFFAKTLTEEQLEIWYTKTKHLSPRIFKQAVSGCIMSEKYFPTIAAFVEKAGKAHENAEQNQIRSFPTCRDVARPSARDSEYTKEAKELFRKVCFRELVDLELAEEMFEMEKKYPNRGWHDAARQVLASFYKRSGIEDFQRLLP